MFQKGHLPAQLFLAGVVLFIRFFWETGHYCRVARTLVCVS
jgi:hypothetical protein